MIMMVWRAAITSYLSCYTFPMARHHRRLRRLPNSVVLSRRLCLSVPATADARRPGHLPCPALTLRASAINKHQTLAAAAPPIDVILTSVLRRRRRHARRPHKFALITGSGWPGLAVANPRRPVAGGARLLL